jgi:hypothetical protein
MENEMSALPNPEALFALRRQQAAQLRTGRKPDAVIGQQVAPTEREPLSLADKPADRRKQPELHLCAGGTVQFF